MSDVHDGGIKDRHELIDKGNGQDETGAHRTLTASRRAGCPQYGRVS